MNRISLILCNFPNLEVAKLFAKKIINNNLAACVSIHDGALSIYQWEGELCSTKEVKVLIKSKKRLYKKIEAEILKLHPDKIPEILSISDVSGYKSYLEWVSKVTI